VFCAIRQANNHVSSCELTAEVNRNFKSGFFWVQHIFPYAFGPITRMKSVPATELKGNIVEKVIDLWHYVNAI